MKSMHGSLAVLILGMHRSGTSVISRSMQALGVYLGNNFLEDQPDNPTGYWEDKGIYQLNERALSVCGLRWEDVRLIDDSKWSQPELEVLRTEAANYIRARFSGHRLWGFKDPRTVRLLPFWQPIFQSLGVDVSYVIAIRNPRSVSISLFDRQQMGLVAARMLWLVYMVPYLPMLRGKPFVVTDYDLFMADPLGQLERVARALNLSLSEETLAAIRDFATHFLNQDLRHSFFQPDDFDLEPNLSPLPREAYLWLRMLATDELPSASPRFWAAWERVSRSLATLLGASGGDCSEAER
jgi:hypothetical protein